MSTLKTSLTALAALVAAAITSAEDMQAVGAVRPDHAQRFSAHRVTLDQLSAACADAQKIAEQDAPPNPDAEAFAALRAELAAAREAASQALNGGGSSALLERVEALAMTVDNLADRVAELIAKG